MTLLNPAREKFENYDAITRDLLLKTVAFFEKKGKHKIKSDDHERVWYDDFLNFAKKEKLFATFLTPPEYGSEGHRWDTYRNCPLNEILGFYGLAYWYTWQVTMLGLGPIWMSKNEALKKKTAALLDAGEIFAYGLSEKEHGADIYASGMTLEALASGNYKANGSKYYIGNGNEAAIVSTFGKISPSQEYVFFAVDSKHKNYECVGNVVNSQSYVAEFKLNDYPINESDILIKGQDAWDACLNTVNIGKYNLGWASIGICSHAFFETLNHASQRRLFDHYVTEFTNIKQFFVDAYSRLVAMKLFALRASDYQRTASLEDRRYLLYNPMVKMKVTTQGEEVINLLWEIMAAKGFEKDMYFEMAVRDIRALPKLEGTVHVNMALIVKFMANYFFKPANLPEIAKTTGLTHDEFLFNQGPTRGLGKIRFHDYRKSYQRR
ncbi:MAG: acyl-CoA dehydrogenase, partial [Calditrichales bacterium]